MKLQAMFFTVLSFLLLLGTFKLFAYEPTRVPNFEDMEYRYGEMCRPTENREMNSLVNKQLKVASSSFNCGNLKEAIIALDQAKEMIYLLMERAGESGNCFSKKNCGRPKVTGGWTSREACEAAGGSSWQRVNPTWGSCINL